MEAKNATAARLESTKAGHFFLNQLKDIYWAEQHLVSSIPKMKDAAHSEILKQAFTDHLQQTRGHVDRLEQIFQMLGEERKAKKCEAMAGITKEGEDIISETEDSTATRDAALIFAAQKVEHYEIATYGSLAQLARELEQNDVAQILNETLREEKEADSLLSQIARDNVNKEAVREQAK